MLTVFRTEIKIGNQITFAYTANEIDINGNPINYLNGTQLAELIGESPNSTVLKRLSKELKSMLGESFSTIQGKMKTEKNTYSKVSLWDTSDCITYWTYHAEKGNRVAFKLICALAVTSLDLIINDAFDRDYEKGKAQQQVNARLEGIDYRVSFTAAIKTFLDANPNEDQALYAICTDIIYRGLFNRRAANLKADWNTKNPRDSMTAKELFLLAEVEDFSARLIKLDNLHPIAAVKQALRVLRIPVSDR